MENGAVFLAIHNSAYGSLMYIIIDDRKLFDAIHLPEEMPNEKVVVKTVWDKGNAIIFQHWLKTVPA